MDRPCAAGGGATRAAVVDDAAAQAPAGRLAGDHRCHPGHGPGVPDPPSVALPDVPDQRHDPNRPWGGLLLVGASRVTRRGGRGMWPMGLAAPGFLEPDRGAAAAL